jgi:hypothetical protein
MLDQNPLPYCLFNAFSPTVETVGYQKIPKRWAI